MSNGYPPPGQQPQQPPQWGQQPQQQPYHQWPQQAPGWGAPMPRKSSTGLIVTLSVVGGLVALILIGVLVAVAGRIADSSAKRKTPMVSSSESSTPAESAPAEEQATEGKDAEADVTLSGCKVDSLTEWPSVVVKITNGTDEASTYIVSVEFVDASGTRVAEGVASASALAPGQVAKQKAQGVGKAPAGTKCKVSNVSRFPSGG
ncbi:FxLYD domain-containing protein [Streptomyces sp. NPDC058231]|uniref:FxLYD domain-containing protein n=1 Tax=Streptomyces sp. NPDC058231 TaxID=3346392 RepID=UPI0036E7E75B